MVGHKAAKHLAVGGVHDGIGVERGNVAAPHGDVVCVEGEGCHMRDAPICQAFLEVGVLDGEKLVACGFRHANVHEGAQQVAAVLARGRHGDAPVDGVCAGRVF